MSENQTDHLSLISPKKLSYEDCKAQAESILESISDGVFTVDNNWRITFFNRAAEQITGIPRRLALGKPCYEIFRSNMCDNDCALRQTMSTGTPLVNLPAYIHDARDHQIPISISTALLRNKDNEVVGCAETFRDLSLVETLARELEGRCQLGDVVTKSQAMRKIIDVIPLVAASDSTVLIQGETGTGKELFAQAIHNLSHRSTHPLISLNCGALPDTLLESELFGYKAGAFTGANKDKPGRFALAEGGTLFLDEIGEISPALQIRLLRVLQEKTYEPLGSTKTLHTDVRVIAATNSNLPELIEDGKFRQDLYYRINVVRVELPPLRNRKEDIPLLVEHFINRFNLIQKKSITGVTREVLSLLMGHNFPGNIRELENIIEHAFVLCSEGHITKYDLPEEFLKKNSVDIGIPEQQIGIEKAVHEVEAQTIIDAIKRNNYNRVAAARELGIHKSTLFRKIKNLGINLPPTDGRSRYPLSGYDFD